VELNTPCFEPKLKRADFKKVENLRFTEALKLKFDQICLAKALDR